MCVCLSPHTEADNTASNGSRGGGGRSGVQGGGERSGGRGNRQHTEGGGARIHRGYTDEMYDREENWFWGRRSSPRREGFSGGAWHASY